MSDPFIGEIRAFAFSFYPGDGNWLPCNGQSVNISDYQALYAVIGNIYGGQPNQQNFVLPNLNGAAIQAYQVGMPMLGAGLGPGLSNYPLGEQIGDQVIQLNESQIPAHNHTVTGIIAETGGTYPIPTAASHLSRYFVETKVCNVYTDQVSTAYLNPATLASSGTGQDHDNMQPYLAVIYAIAVNGVFPTRP